MRVGILTYHAAINYGAILQCYALQNILSQDDSCDVKVINYTPAVFNNYFPNPKKFWKTKSIKTKLFYLAKWILRRDQTKKESTKYEKLVSFINSKLKLTKPLHKEELQLLNKDFDVFITGSDQVWNLEMTNRDTAFLLDFAQKKKISYAASTKISALTDNDVDCMKKILPSFSHISVREEDVCEYLNKMGLHAECDIDPTLLMDRSEWENLINNVTTKLHDYILVYHVNAPEKMVDKAFEYAQRNGLKVVSLNRLNTKYDYYDYSDASIEEFLYLIKNANCVFTTSFHGLVFSIIFNTNFFFEIPDNSQNNNQRLLNLARKLGVEKQSLQEGHQLKIDINWDTVNEKLKKLRDCSIQRLNNYIYK